MCCVNTRSNRCPSAWSAMQAGLAPGGLVVDGTCDELGRRCSWVLLDAEGPVSLTLACDPFAIDRPSDLAERLPKVLIHHNIDRPADPRAADRRRPCMGQRRRPRCVRSAGALAGHAGSVARQGISGRATAPPPARRCAHRALGSSGAGLDGLRLGPACQDRLVTCSMASTVSSRASSTSCATWMSRPRSCAGVVASDTAT